MACCAEGGYFKRLLDMQNALPHSVDVLLDDGAVPDKTDAVPEGECACLPACVPVCIDV